MRDGGKLLVGLGLVVMASAIAYLGAVSERADIGPTIANGATATAFWIFLAGVLIAIAGGLSGRAQR